MNRTYLMPGDRVGDLILRLGVVGHWYCGRIVQIVDGVAMVDRWEHSDWRPLRP